MSQGKIVQCIGAVVDIEFPRDQMPKVYDALTLQAETGSIAEEGLTFEVQQQLGDGVVRTIAMGSSDGLKRGMPVMNTHNPITVPVGLGTLGRIMDVLGRPIDDAGPIQCEERRPIHANPPKFDELSPSIDLLETGIKVIDLALGFAVLLLDLLQKTLQRSIVGGVTGHDLISQGESLRGYDQGNDHLHAIQPLVPAVAMLTSVAFRKGRIALKIRAGQIVQEYLKLRIEQIFPTLRQMIKQRSLMLHQPVQALIEFMDLRQFKPRSQKVRHRALLIPVPMQPPFAAGLHQTITTKRLHDQIPTRPLAARRQPLRKELIQPQLLVQLTR